MRKKRDDLPKRINYTARDFRTIKEELVEHTKRYYPDTFADFSEASFGSLMLDTVAYVGDMLSFYLDYQANEAFIDTSVERDNLIRHARRLGFDPFSSQAASSGFLTLYLTVPANSPGAGPDESYLPILRRGATFQSTTGHQFVLTEDVDFGAVNNETVVAAVNDVTGIPQTYAVKAHGSVISGGYFESIIEVGSYKPYRRIEIYEPHLVEIVSVQDNDGNHYYQVDYLSQDVVYQDIANPSYDGSEGSVQSLLKPFSVPRRFTVESYSGRVILQFGAGSESDIGESTLVDPSAVVLDQYGKSYLSDKSFDPSSLLKTEKLGISPSNTDLQIVYRANTGPRGSINARSDSIKEIVDAKFKWKDFSQLVSATADDVRMSLQVTNETPMIGDTEELNNHEIRLRAKSAYASQNRAVTREDYVSAIYSMPPKFGRVKRCAVVRDHDSLKRNLNVYVISESPMGDHLIGTNDAIKQNIKTWLSNKKMINDTVDILNARKVNFSLTFVVLVDEGVNKYDVLANCELSLRRYFGRTVPDIGEPFVITDVYKILNSTTGVADALDVEVEQMSGGAYSDLKFDVGTYTTPDNRQIRVPDDVIWEIYDPMSDISGVVK